MRRRRQRRWRRRRSGARLAVRPAVGVFGPDLLAGVRLAVLAEPLEPALHRLAQSGPTAAVGRQALLHGAHFARTGLHQRRGAGHRAAASPHTVPSPSLPAFGWLPGSWASLGKAAGLLNPRRAGWRKGQGQQCTAWIVRPPLRLASPLHSHPPRLAGCPHSGCPSLLCIAARRNRNATLCAL